MRNKVAKRIRKAASLRTWKEGYEHWRVYRRMKRDYKKGLLIFNKAGILIVNLPEVERLKAFRDCMAAELREAAETRRRKK